MGIEIGPLTEATQAHVAFQWALLEMNGLLMNLERTLAAEALWAGRAFMGALLEMHGRDVDTQVVGASKLLCAVCTCKGTLLAMDTGDVAFQRPFLSEPRRALRAAKGTGLVMCTRHMTIVAGDPGERLAAQMTHDASGGRGGRGRVGESRLDGDGGRRRMEEGGRIAERAGGGGLRVDELGDIHGDRAQESGDADRQVAAPTLAEHHNLYVQRTSAASARVKGDTRTGCTQYSAVRLTS